MTTKAQNISNTGSCWNRADFDEPVFILLGRDESAMIAIHAWIKDRVRLGKNEVTDPQITEAMNCIQEMSRYHAKKEAEKRNAKGG